MGRLVVNAEKCSGCRLCQLMCSLHHEGVFDITKSRLKIVESELWKFSPIVCDFCEEPACAAVCPTDALLTLAAGGVEVIEGKCIGCSKCIEVCKNHLIRLCENLPKPLVCDLCGDNPACVDICPMQAILYENDEYENIKEEEQCHILAGF